MGDASHPSDTIELQHPQGLLTGDAVPIVDSSTDEQLNGSGTPPDHAVSALPTWNQNKANVFKTLSTFMAFITIGANDAAYGVSTGLPDATRWNICVNNNIIGHHTLCKLQSLVSNSEEPHSCNEIADMMRSLRNTIMSLTL